MNQKKIERIKLLLIGLAASEACGSTSEFVPQSQIPALYAKHKHQGWPFKQVGGGAFGWKPGEMTDDGQMAMCIVRSYLDLGRFDGGDVARRFVGWMKSGPRDIGGTTAAALSRLATGVPWYEGGLHTYTNNPSNAANGSLMRNGVVPALADMLDEAFQYTLHQGITTHYSPLAVLCCIAQTFWIWELLEGRWPFESDWLADLRERWDVWLGRADDTTNAWRRVVAQDLPGAWQTLAEAEFDPHRFNPFTINFGGRAGYCLLTLQIAAWALQWSKLNEPFPVPAGFPAEVFERRGAWCVAWPAMVGHDADTYGAALGAAVAALYVRIPPVMADGLQALRELDTAFTRQ